MSRKKPTEAEQARSLALLWGSHSKPGRSGLTVRAIVAAAIELADAQGIDAVAMRHLADRLKVGTMSLYTHVGGKDELTDLMIDTVYGQLYDDVGAPSRQPGGWRSALAFIATRNWDLYQQHPWMLDIVRARPLLGPHASRKYEAELRPLDTLGLSDVEMDTVLTLVLTHVEGTARSQANLVLAQRDSGLSDAEWWVATAPLLDKVMDATQFPVAARVGVSTGQQYQAASHPAHVFAFGLDRILDGVALLIAARAEQQAAR
ncbi:MAG: TetR/AcrR family transcriptional regulator [Roseiflexaceae bacterium]|nr:TetR/AcrR family transcriptional regulator [Roseiflexaceae bacterium]